VVRLLELLGEAMEGIRAGADPRTRLELGLVKAARPEIDSSLKALLARIERLEGSPPAPTVTAAGAGGLPIPAASSDSQPGAGGAGPQIHPVDAEADGERGPAPTAAAPSTGEAVAVAVLADTAEREVGMPAGESHGHAPEAVSEGDWLRSISSLWPAVVDLVRGEHALLGALIADARPVGLEGDNLLLAFEQNAQLYKKKAEDPDNRAIVGEALRSVTGSRWRLSYELRELAVADGEPPGEQSEERRVARFMQEFDAEEIPGEWGAAGEARGPSREASGAADGDVEALTSNQKGD